VHSLWRRLAAFQRPVSARDSALKKCKTRDQDLEDLIENLAAACNHAEDKRVEERLDTIYQKLVKLLG